MSHMILGKYSDSDIYEIWHSNGRINYTGSDCNLDLFFADEEEELTELQKTLEEDCDYYVKLYNDGNTREELREWIKCWCHRIIELARKEIEKENPYSGNQNKEWSEEDEKLYTSALWHIKNSCGNGGKDSGEYEVYNWLKSIKDRIQPKPKQEWSEEDEKMCSQVINEMEAIKSNSSTIFEKNIAEEKIDWLKSIKSKKYWKPSEEQLTDLYYAAKQLSVTRPNLQILYNDIKQL